jgi:hypothetical protein
MKTDLYTKFVLTVIALTAIAIQITIKDANAQSFIRDAIQRIAICNQNTQGGTYWCADNVMLPTRMFFAHGGSFV